MSEDIQISGASRRGLLALGLAATATAAACAPAAPVLPPAATGRRFEGRRVLITGATSGIGVMAIQMAKAAGARIIATARGAEKAQVARDLGADIAVNVLTNVEFPGYADRFPFLGAAVWVAIFATAAWRRARTR